MSNRACWSYGEGGGVAVPLDPPTGAQQCPYWGSKSVPVIGPSGAQDHALGLTVLWCGVDHICPCALPSTGGVTPRVLGRQLPLPPPPPPP